MVKGVLLDLAGVLYDGAVAIPGSVAAVARLRAAGLPVRFLTNSTRAPRRVLLDRLAGLGFDVAPEQVFTPASAACDRLRRDGLKAHLLIHPDLVEDFRDLPQQGTARAVVVGDAADGFSYANMNAAFRELAGGAQLIALAANRTFRDADGELSIDVGAFVKALEFASGRVPQVLGKPEPAFFNAALSDMGVAAGDAAMVGDDAEADVGGALRAGIGRAVLVRTGKYQAGDEARSTPAPSHVAADLSAAVDWLLQG